jgi:hypothetical protein
MGSDYYWWEYAEIAGFIVGYALIWGERASNRLLK